MPKPEAIIKLGDWMRDETFRKKFVENSLTAMHPLKPKDIGENLYEALKNMSVDALAKMSNVGAALREDGASGDAAFCDAVLRMV